MAAIPRSSAQFLQLDPHHRFPWFSHPGSPGSRAGRDLILAGSLPPEQHAAAAMTLSKSKQEVIYRGIPASPGIAMGPVHVTARGFSAPDVYEISELQIPREQARFRRAVGRTKRQLIDLQIRLEDLSGEGESGIFEAHVMLLEDRALINKVSDAISGRRQNAEYAFYAIMQNFLEAMRRIPDPYLRERTADIEDVCQRVLRNFHGEEDTKHPLPDGQHVLVAYDVAPSDAATFDRRNVLGFATELGSSNSHTSILARSLGIPAVVGLESVVIEVTTLAPVILDGYTGRLIVYPTEETLAHYHALVESKDRLRAMLADKRGESTSTTDGREIGVSANVELIAELDAVRASGAKGIGLYRTEFLLLNNNEIPGEDEQTIVYSRFAQEMAPHRVVIRTLDAGGDKLPVEPLTEPEPNPFLGWRGIRVSLSRPDMFREQIRAILRASAHGKVAMMFPLVSGLSEILEAREIVRECMDKLAATGIPFDPAIPVGIMIEVPSAAICAHMLAPYVDFFSIGTNDLIQYTVAVDRINPHVAALYRATHPAVIRLIRMTVEAGEANGIRTGVCGETAADVRLTPLLLGLGVQDLSVGPHLVPTIGQAIRSLSHADCVAMAQQALQESRSQVILDQSTDLARAAYPELFD